MSPQNMCPIAPDQAEAALSLRKSQWFLAVYGLCGPESIVVNRSLRDSLVSGCELFKGIIPHCRQNISTTMGTIVLMKSSKVSTHKQHKESRTLRAIPIVVSFIAWNLAGLASDF